MREVTYRTKPTSTEDGKLVFTYDNAVVRKYSWGLDLSGWSGDASPSGIHNAGGIGGLLAAVETSGPHAGSYWYLYDANGNVGQVLNATDPQSITPAAHYEYDAYGNSAVAPTGTYADANPFRFSTKWRDAETGLYCFGRRCYDSILGRALSRRANSSLGGENASDRNRSFNSPRVQFESRMEHRMRGNWMAQLPSGGEYSFGAGSPTSGGTSPLFNMDASTLCNPDTGQVMQSYG